MIRVSPSVRISLGLVFITLSVLLLGHYVGLIPDQSKVDMEVRKSAAESLAMQTILAARNNNFVSIRKNMDAIVDSHPEVLSLGLRDFDGRYRARTEDHQIHWVAPSGKDSTSTHWQLPIDRDGKQWGTLEISFMPQGLNFVMGYRLSPFTLLLVFFVLISFTGFVIFLRRTLRHLDPTSVMPKRVQYALDTITDGVIIVNREERIILANSAFAKKLGCTAKALMGLRASELDWINAGTSKPPEVLPWSQAMSQKEIQSDIPLNLAAKFNEVLFFRANAAPILDDKGKSRGALATFNDITELEKKNHELSKMLELLQQSNYKVELQKQELEIIATKDSLTGCLNRRAFFAKAQRYMETSVAEGLNLACIMVDLDLFKSINDTHGHIVGDQVIMYLAKTLESATRGDDAVCRYGGEEFCVLLPNCDIEETSIIAERVRCKLVEDGAKAIAQAPGIRISASFGISDFTCGANDIKELIAQADRALYMAKVGGRNCLVSWDSYKENAFLQQSEKDMQTSSLDA
jgi:diguanylate cyclase (GGDEF)-like protein/PAS domain S-box-containing protein